MQLIPDGTTNKEIATILGVNPSTGEAHSAHLMEELDLHSAPEVVLYVVRRGVIR